MTLEEIYQQLAYGELRMLNLGEINNDGILSEDNYARLLPHVNAALTALHKRFLIKQGSIDIALQPERYIYPLTRNHALSNNRSQEDKYILDDEYNPFTGDIIKIERVLLPTGFEPKLNVYTDLYSFTTPSLTTIAIPKDVVDGKPDLPDDLKVETVQILYRANHVKLTEDDGADFPEDMEVELPELYLEPLLYYIASRLHNPIGMTNEFHMGNSYYAKYEAACRDIENQGYYINHLGEDNRLRRNGWV